MFDKLLVLATTSVLTAFGTAILSTVSIFSVPLTPAANAQAQPQRLKQEISAICKTGAPITPNCVPKDGNFRLVPPGYSVDPRITPPKELPKPEPRPVNEDIPSINVR